MTIRSLCIDNGVKEIRLTANATGINFRSEGKHKFSVLLDEDVPAPDKASLMAWFQKNADLEVSAQRGTQNIYRVDNEVADITEFLQAPAKAKAKR